MHFKLYSFLALLTLFALATRVASEEANDNVNAGAGGESQNDDDGLSGTFDSKDFNDFEFSGSNWMSEDDL